MILIYKNKQTENFFCALSHTYFINENNHFFRIKLRNDNFYARRERNEREVSFLSKAARFFRIC